ncbi:AhpC/TSA family protein, partial [Bacteroides sp. OttesenSCG-928-D19]|nr:AhpC/TSA family protein [Bacteroides sp. OttesenSCG-928-D19]
MKITNRFYQKNNKPINQWENLIACLTLIFAFTACTQRNTVTGHIQGLTNDTIFVDVSSLVDFENEPVRDTVLAKNGRFKYTFPNNGLYGLYFSFPQFFVLERPGGGIYVSDNSSLIVFAEQGSKIHIKGETNSEGLCNVFVSGSQLNVDFSLIQRKMFEINANQVVEEMALEQAMVDRNKEAEDIGWANRKRRQDARKELFSNFIRTNLDNPLSAFLLLRQPLDSVGKYYDQLGENVRNSEFHYALDNQLEQYKKYISAMKAKEEVIVGTKAPDFTLDGIDGKPITLSSFRGKYVIIDFWGSWCGPCIVGIPKMKSTYEKYKDKLEILGVACREESINSWQNAVAQHKLSWINVYNDKLSAVNVKYGIEGYPTKLVIDPDGIILIREVGEGENFYTKLESIIK